MADSEKILHSVYNYKGTQGGKYIKVYFETGAGDVAIPAGLKDTCYGSTTLDSFIQTVVQKIAGLNPLTIIRSSFQFDPEEVFTRPGQMLYEFNTGRVKIADGTRSYKNLPYICDDKYNESEQGEEDPSDALDAINSEPGDTVDKTVTIDDYTHAKGNTVVIQFAENNTADTPTLTINGHGPYPITKDGIPIHANDLLAGVNYKFEFTGTSFEIVGIVTDNTESVYPEGYGEDYSISAQQKIPAYVASVVYVDSEDGDLPENFDVGALEVLSSAPTDGRAAFVLEVA